MATVSLSQYAADKSNAEVARELGVSRAAISQMLESAREIYVETDAVGAVLAWEKRTIPARRTSAA